MSELLDPWALGRGVRQLLIVLAVMRRVRFPAHNPGWELTDNVFRKSTPEESDGFSTPGVFPRVLTFPGGFNPGFDLPFLLFSHRFTLPGIPPTSWFIGGFGIFLTKRENVAQR